MLGLTNLVSPATRYNFAFVVPQLVATAHSKTLPRVTSFSRLPNNSRERSASSSLSLFHSLSPPRAALHNCRNNQSCPCCSTLHRAKNERTRCIQRTLRSTMRTNAEHVTSNEGGKKKTKFRERIGRETLGCFARLPEIRCTSLSRCLFFQAYFISDDANPTVFRGTRSRVSKNVLLLALILCLTWTIEWTFPTYRKGAKFKRFKRSISNDNIIIQMDILIEYTE